MSAAIQTQERRQFNQNLVAELQEERHQVWSLYCKVAEHKPFSCSPETQSLLTQFSQLLIDYVSLGHFGIYERLFSGGGELRDGILTSANDIYSAFSETTEAVMSFNDKYDTDQQTLTVDKLEADLSILGEHLAKRIDLEDTFCDLVLN